MSWEENWEELLNPDDYKDTEETNPPSADVTPESEDNAAYPEDRPHARKKIRTVPILLGAAGVLTAILIGILLCGYFFVLADGHLYARHADTLDLRGKSISEDTYRKLAEALPECEIYWDVPFQGGIVDSTTRELTVQVLSSEDVAALCCLTRLETLHAEQCTDYDALLLAREQLPGCQVLYNVSIDGTIYHQGTETVSVSHLTEEEVPLLSYLPALRVIDGSSCGDYRALAQAQTLLPACTVRYTVELGDSRLSPDTREATVTDADSAQLIAGLPGLQQLETLTLINPKADGDTLQALRTQYPDLAIAWQFVLNGNTYGEEAEDVNASNQDFASMDAVEAMVTCFPHLKTFFMGGCTLNGTEIDNETMAAFREQMRDTCKIIWTVTCGPLMVRTDATTFMPTREGVYYFKDSMSYNLRYCEDMICVDVGHHPLTDISFVRYMPHLKYLILTETQVQDISALQNATELVFLELTFGIVRDYSPLLGCTALEDLNMDKLWYHADVEPLYHMTWLKTLFWEGCSSAVQVRLAEALPNTRLDYTGTTTNSVNTGWRNLQNYYDMRDILGMYYMN